MQTKDLDQLVKEYKEARDESSKWDNKKSELKLMLIEILESLGKTKYFVDGYGTISISVSNSVKTPKDAESKLKFFSYLREEYGEELVTSMQTVNSRTLNSFFNEELAKKEKAGEYGFTLPGIEEPTNYVTLKFNKG